MKQVSLSASSVGVFCECPRCFWFDKVKGSPRPRGIFPSLPGGVDAKLKAYYDVYRAHTSKPDELMIPELKGYDLYFDIEKLNKFRNWRSGLKVECPKWTLIGALDDLLCNRDTGLFVPLDYKTKSKEAVLGEVIKYYQRQLDFYALMLKENKMPVADFGIIASYYPIECNRTEAGEVSISFGVTAFKVDTDPIRARQLLDEAAVCLNLDAPPPAAEECEYCALVTKRK